MTSLKDIARDARSLLQQSVKHYGHSDISEERKRLIRRSRRDGISTESFCQYVKDKSKLNIGVLFNDAAHNCLTHDYLQQFWIGFKAAVEQKNYDFDFSELQQNRNR